MAKWVCSVCGYVHEGDAAPEKCPVCGVPAEKFIKQDSEMTWAAEHVVGVAQGVDPEIIEDLRANFNGECSEVGMYLALRSANTGRQQHSKKQSMLLSSQSFSVKYSLTAPRRTSR